MSRWQRKARLASALAAVGLAATVALTFRRAPGPGADGVPLLAPSDPKALVESASGDTIRINRDKEEIRIAFDTYLTYPDGTTKGQGVKVTTTRAGGRTFVISGRQAEVGQNETNVTLAGDVRLQSSDGMEAMAESATYTDADALVRAPGPVTFARGRLRGSGHGLTYAKNSDVLTVHERVSIQVSAGSGGTGPTTIAAGSAEFSRLDHVIRFHGGMTVARAGQTIEADTGLARLSDDEQRLEAVELRGRARMTPAGAGAGGLTAMRGDAIDLIYRPDGETPERAFVSGGAEAQIGGARGAGDRVIAASTLDVGLAADGSTPTSLAARENVRLTIPAEQGAPARSIRAQTLDGEGEPGRGLTRARFAGDVVFTERGPAVDRAARAGALDVTLAPGLGQIEDARFAQTVRFEDGALRAAAARARYLPVEGALELTGSEPALRTPQVETDRISVYAERIDVALAGPTMLAVGSVKSELKPVRAAAGSPRETRLPAMFEEDRLVAATAGQLVYDSAASTATYERGAQLWQGDISIKADRIDLNAKSGDLGAAGSVVTRMPLEQETKNKKRERVSTSASSSDFHYEEASRRATYVGGARAQGPQGDVTAEKIELYLNPSGDALERAEAFDTVMLRDQNRETKGERLTYFATEERYVMTGSPVTIRDECGSETTGAQVTYDKRSDTIVVDASQGTRTRTRGGSNCP